MRRPLEAGTVISCNMHLFNTSGLGFAVARRLLEEDKSNSLQLCLLCRNALSAEKARNTLLTSFPQASIDLIAVDTSRPHSVVSACEEIATR